MDPEYHEPAGRQHYRLLEELSNGVSSSTIVDIGTHRGMSALALSVNPTNTVISFDIVEKTDRPIRPNIRYTTDDLMTDTGRETWRDTLLSAPFILLDIDPHEGTREYEFYCWLRDNDYRGFMICDDIWYFKEMRDNFWYKIPNEHKIDITTKGHWSGTGVVRFHPSEQWPTATRPTNWTVVTAYFDLTKMPDASSSIKARPSQHYLDSAMTTLSLDHNLVVFCEPGMECEILSRRPVHLHSKLKLIPMSFEDFPLTKYRKAILENRSSNPDHDDRNTASYYLLCMARYAMLNQVIQENPFQSTHFAWLNICIERMGWKNTMYLDRVFELQRDKFSTCYIDYQPVSSMEDVVRNGRCTMCSGFFTGNAYFMKTFCDRIEQKFLKYLQLGIGHADEQLYSSVYFEDRSIFDVYYGDYSEMITNYEWVRDRPAPPIYNFIRHSYESGDYESCLPACKLVWRSFTKGYVDLNEREVQHLLWYYRNTLEKCGLPRVFE